MWYGCFTSAIRWHGVMSERTIDFWFDFASTYSYPAMMRMEPLARAGGVTVRLRPFLLGPIFQAQGWPTSPFNLYPAKGQNMWRDLERLCADLEIPFRRPANFPQNSLLAARIALVGLDDTWGAEFCRSVFRAEFADDGRIDDEALLSEILSGLQVAPERALDAATSDANKTRLRSQTEEAQKLGIFGAPSFVTADAEVFWGNDRLERALTWARDGR